MKRAYLLFIFFKMIPILMLLAGCGQFVATGTGLPTATALSSHTPGVTPSEAKAGTVTLLVEAHSYQLKDTISVTLGNQSRQTIYFPDHLTNCSVILLQRLAIQPLESDSGPTGVSPCRSEVVTRIHTLVAKQRLVVKLVAPSTGWLPGLYRASLTYSVSLPASSPKTIYSVAFLVGSFVPQP